MRERLEGASLPFSMLYTRKTNAMRVFALSSMTLTL
jgi:hypothetical protein